MKTLWSLTTKLLLALALLAVTFACGGSDPSVGRDKDGRPRKGSYRLAGSYQASNRTIKPLSLADLQAKYPSTLIMKGHPSDGTVALTFDDAPDNHFTPMILDVLKKEGIRATFFVVGSRAMKHPEIMQRIVAEGHVIGNHSYDHANLPKLTDAAFREQITKTDRVIKEYTGYTPSYIRPPYGNISEEQLKWLASHHRKVVNWNVDSVDWKGLNVDEVCANVLPFTKAGSIILQHSGGGKGENLLGTVEALPHIIAAVREKGLSFATVAEMIPLRQND